ncbi:type VI secretion system protein TssA [Massilia sp. CCM 9210]|uniref:type VI secretion system protein TssA n=1 Tax=Massilia scottii TaxID=3057166 RepID=UPI0027966D0E|nr:type VI secretion system protein TssA [Massilia sp. CCM 9210]MDQ1812078.1 type VI secretion system protein TssA [Massilia sp. CCM 9210]
MDSTFVMSPSDYFLDQFGISFAALVAPIDAAMPSGRSVRGKDIYNTIEQARRQDDPSLPMGTWEHDLKRADWDKVANVAVDALAHQSKDLQIAVWLLEAQINKAGFAGIAPCMLLMQTLCERFWDDIHPQAEDGDMEYRANIIRWADKKLLAALRLADMSTCAREREYCWADWELARRNDQVRAAPDKRKTAPEGVSAAEVLAAMTATPTEAHVRRYRVLADALEAIAALLEALDERFGREAPSLIELSELLEQIQSFIGAELHKRGLRVNIPLALPELPEVGPALLGCAPADAEPVVAERPIRDRAEAYARLALIGDFLMQLEPHSPVPYLVQRATSWGQMNTAQLYQELFLDLGGQLNIFEMLGLDPKGEQARS